MNLFSVIGSARSRWLLSAALWLGSAGVSQALAFDCEKPGNGVETAVCGQAKLHSMAEKIDEAVAHISQHSEHPEHIKENQKNWLELLNQCGQNLRCLNEMLERRVERLEKIEAVQAAAPAKRTAPTQTTQPAQASEAQSAEHSDQHPNEVASEHAETPAAEPSNEAHAHAQEPAAAVAEQPHEAKSEKSTAEDGDEEAPPAHAAAGFAVLGTSVADWVKAHPFLIVALLLGSWIVVGLLFLLQKMGGWGAGGKAKPQTKHQPKPLSASAAAPGKPPRVSGKVSKPSAPPDKAKPKSPVGSKWLDRLGEKLSWWRFFVKHQFRNQPLRAYGVTLLMVLTVLAVAYGVTRWSEGQGQPAPHSVPAPDPEGDEPSAPIQAPAPAPAPAPQPVAPAAQEDHHPGQKENSSL